MNEINNFTNIYKIDLAFFRLFFFFINSIDFVITNYEFYFFINRIKKYIYMNELIKRLNYC